MQGQNHTLIYLFGSIWMVSRPYYISETFTRTQSRTHTISGWIRASGKWPIVHSNRWLISPVPRMAVSFPWWSAYFSSTEAVHIDIHHRLKWFGNPNGQFPKACICLVATLHALTSLCISCVSVYRYYWPVIYLLFDTEYKVGVSRKVSISQDDKITHKLKIKPSRNVLPISTLHFVGLQQVLIR
jgi:hypothetical protein